MQLAKIIGNATATVKHASLVGEKLLVVQPLMRDGRSPDGDPQLAIDRLGAGTGETVLLTTDGKFVSDTLGKNAPVRWTVLGIQDP